MSVIVIDIGKSSAMKRKSLGTRLRRNWLRKHPEEPTCATSAGLDDSLTCLDWLQALGVAGTGPGGEDRDQPVAPPSVLADPNAILDMGSSSNIQQLSIKQEPGLKFNSLRGGVEVAPPRTSGPSNLSREDYKKNHHVKPPYSYATLIRMALQESKDNKLTLADIYSWITDNFTFYRKADPSWQNSIRHNLSLNKSFEKVARRRDEPGKGGFWRINAESEDPVFNGLFKKRTASIMRESIAPCAKRIKTSSSEPTVEDNEESALIQAAASASASSQSVLHLDDDDLVDALDPSWSAILNKDIEVGGVCIKTEDIINGEDSMDSVGNSITSRTSSPSDGSSDVAVTQNNMLGVGLDTDFDSPFSFLTDNALNLAMGDSGYSSHDSVLDSSAVTPSVMDSHPWVDDRLELDHAIASLDSEIQDLFNIKDEPWLASRAVMGL